jgi:hypothetical protein
VILLAVGGVWFFQGIGTIGGSFMTGDRIWEWVGLACAAAGVVLVVAGLRGPRRAPGGEPPGD